LGVFENRQVPCVRLAGGSVDDIAASRLDIL
jgi:hypothetical protein